MVMRARWRGFELPTRLELDRDSLTPEYGKFVAEPFEHGFGTTIGNAMRRVLLSSIEGAAVTHVKIDGALHEFTSLDGVLEDVTNIVLNIKRIRVRMDSEQTAKLVLDVQRKGEIYAGDFEGGPGVEVVNKEHVICTCTEEVPLRMELTVARGRGYRTAEENDSEDREIGVIPVDSSFSPVRRVRYRTENTRVGQLTDYDKLILEVWTDGTIDPEHAVVQAGKILRKHLIPFVNYFELGEELAAAAASLQATEPVIGAEPERLMPVSELGLTTRTLSALLGGGIATVGDLLDRTEEDLLALANFGQKALEEVKQKLDALGQKLRSGAATS